MCKLLHILQPVEGGQYLVVVEAQHATHYVRCLYVTCF
jgi:hypothetical protein